MQCQRLEARKNEAATVNGADPMHMESPLTPIPSDDEHEGGDNAKVAGPSKSKPDKRVSFLFEDSDGDEKENPEAAAPSEARNAIEDHLATAFKGVTALRQDLRRVQARNADLQREIDILHNSTTISIQPKRGEKGNASVPELSTRVKQLTEQVAQLEKSREKNKKRIRKLRRKEIEREAAELEDEAEYGVFDATARLRKLLRRFRDLMLTPSFEEGEECSICIEPLTQDTARCLPCQHVFCADCLPRIARDQRICPQCRAPFDPVAAVHDAERVEMTATEQWDALLEVANDWVRMEEREGAVTTTDEEEEEELPFIVEEEEEEEEEKEDAQETSNPPAPHSPKRLRKAPAPAPAPASEPELPSGPSSRLPPPTTAVLRSLFLSETEKQKQAELIKATFDSIDAPPRPSSTTLRAAPPKPILLTTPAPDPAPGGRLTRSTAAAAAAATAVAVAARAITPPASPERASYQASPTSEKRRRMEALAMARAKKRRI